MRYCSDKGADLLPLPRTTRWRTAAAALGGAQEAPVAVLRGVCVRMARREEEGGVVPGTEVFAFGVSGWRCCGRGWMPLYGGDGRRAHSSSSVRVLTIPFSFGDVAGMYRSSKVAGEWTGIGPPLGASSSQPSLSRPMDVLPSAAMILKEFREKLESRRGYAPPERWDSFQRPKCYDLRTHSIEGIQFPLPLHATISTTNHGGNQ